MIRNLFCIFGFLLNDDVKMTGKHLLSRHKMQKMGC